MAIYHEDIVNINLESGSIHRSFINQTIGCGDKLANRFGIRAFRNGVPENIGGTCVGFFIRSDGGTVIINNGVVNGNLAYVTLPETCYTAEGRFSLAIKCQGGGVTGTMRIVDGMVSQTSTETPVDPGTVIPSIEDLIDAIDAAVASVPPDYSSLWETIAPEFDPGEDYSAGQYVTYDGKAYRFITTHSGTWDPGDAEEISVGNEITETNTRITDEITETNTRITNVEDDLNNKINWIPSFTNVKNMLPDPLFFNESINMWGTNVGSYTFEKLTGSIGYAVRPAASSGIVRIETFLPIEMFKTSTTYRIKCNKTPLVNGRAVVVLCDAAKVAKSYLLNSDPQTGNYDFTFDTPDGFNDDIVYVGVQFTNTSGGTATAFSYPMLFEGAADADFFSPLYYELSGNSILTGKKICLAGDSICYGAGYTGGYGAFLAAKYGMIVQNIGVSGACIAQVENKACISDLISTVDNDGEYYIYEGGFNDSGNSVPLGAETYSDTIDATMTFDRTIYRDAFEYLCRDLAINHREKKIGFIFPHRIVNRDTGNWGNFKALSVKLLEKYGIPYLDLAKVSGLDTALAELAVYTQNSDGVHPTENGYRYFYIDKIARWLESL